MSTEWDALLTIKDESDEDEVDNASQSTLHWSPSPRPQSNSPPPVVLSHPPVKMRTEAQWKDAEAKQRARTRQGLYGKPVESAFLRIVTIRVHRPQVYRETRSSFFLQRRKAFFFPKLPNAPAMAAAASGLRSQNSPRTSDAGVVQTSGGCLEVLRPDQHALQRSFLLSSRSVLSQSRIQLGEERLASQSSCTANVDDDLRCHREVSALPQGWLSGSACVNGTASTTRPPFSEGV